MKLKRVIPVVAGIALIFFIASCKGSRKLAKRRHYMQETYESLKGALNEGEVTLLSDTIRVMFPKNVMFEFKKAEVREDMKPVLQRLAGVLNEYKKTSILVIGRTDSIGGDNGNNQQLSERRADSARAVLEYYGVANKRMEHWGLGAKDPIASNATEEGRARNRSVEFVVLRNH